MPTLTIHGDTKTRTHTNDTPRWQIVGDCSAVLGEHATADEAKAALAAMPGDPDDCCESGYGVIEIVAPGRSVSTSWSAAAEAEHQARLERDAAAPWGESDVFGG